MSDVVLLDKNGNRLTTSTGAVIVQTAGSNCCVFQARLCSDGTLAPIYVKQSSFPNFPASFYFAIGSTRYYVTSSDVVACSTTPSTGLTIATGCGDTGNTIYCGDCSPMPGGLSLTFSGVTGASTPFDWSTVACAPSGTPAGTYMTTGSLSLGTVCVGHVPGTGCIWTNEVASGYNFVFSTDNLTMYALVQVARYQDASGFPFWYVEVTASSTDGTDPIGDCWLFRGIAYSDCWDTAIASNNLGGIATCEQFCATGSWGGLCIGNGRDAGPLPVMGTDGTCTITPVTTC